MGQTISLGDLSGPPASSGGEDSSGPISLDDLYEKPKPVDHGKRYQAPPLPSNNLLRTAGQGMDAAGHLIESAATHPLETGKGVIKGLAGAAVGIAEMAPEGAAMVGDMVSTWMGGKPGVGTAAMQGWIDKTNKVAAAITHINLTPKGTDQEAFSNLLNVLPNAATALGEDVQEMYGSAALSTAVETGANGLMLLSPEKARGAVEPLKQAIDKPKEAKPASVQQFSAFDELAANDPEKAHEFANHIKKADPDLGDKLNSRAAEVAAKPAEVVGKDVAKKKIKMSLDQAKTGLSQEATGGAIRETVSEGYKQHAAAPLEAPAAEDMEPSFWEEINGPEDKSDDELDPTHPYNDHAKETVPNTDWWEVAEKSGKHNYGGPLKYLGGVEQVGAKFKAWVKPYGEDVIDKEFLSLDSAKKWANEKMLKGEKTKDISLEQEPQAKKEADESYKTKSPIDTKKQAEGVPSKGKRDLAYNAMGELIHPTPEGRRAFKNWFGGSKVVDDKGRPLVYVHGTNKGDIKVFKPGMGEGIFTTPDMRTANTFDKGGGHFYPLYVKAEKPFDFSRPTHRAELEKQLRKNGAEDDMINYIIEGVEEGRWNAIEDERTIKAIKQLGYDSFHTFEAGAKNLAVFSPDQVKSAVHNVGEFSRYDHDIYASPKRSVMFRNAVQDEYVQAHFDPDMQKTWDSLLSIRNTDRVASTHSVLDQMIKSSPKDGYVRAILEHLRKRVPDTDIKIASKLTLDGKEVSGIYDNGDEAGTQPKSISLSLTDNPSPWSFQVLAHEMVHAATADFIIKNPDHPLVHRLHELQDVAWAQLKQLDDLAKEKGIDLRGGLGAGKNLTDAHGTFYGVSHVLEMVAEIKTSSHFNQLLAMSSRFSTLSKSLGQTVNRLADKISSILGFPKSSQALIREIMHVTDRIMDQQAIQNATKGIANMRKEQRAAAPSEDPTMYMEEGKEVKQSAVSRAFTFAMDNRGTEVTKGKLKEYYEWAARLVNPEALGPAAKKAAAVLGHTIAEQMQRDTWNSTRSKARRSFWNSRLEGAADFIKGYEKGKKFTDPMLEKAAQAYKNWNNRMALEDTVLGLEYEPVDNYLYHTFQDSDGVAKFFERRYGTKWGDPSFTKQRTFDLYEEAVEAGFKPKYSNPEDIMIARQHASDVARMKVQTFNDLESYGLAARAEKGVDPPYNATKWRSPTGENYWVHNDAHAVLHNAWETKSLWTMKGPPGDLFRGAMWLKNAIVPIKLGFSLFHPLHVATIDNATGMVRATKGLMGGTVNPAAWVAKMIGSAVYKDAISAPLMGGRILKAYKGLIDADKLTDTDKLQLQYMAEGGLIPTMSEQFRNNAKKKFKDAMEQHNAKAVLHAPFAGMEWVQGFIFDKWIPSLKVASYTKDVKTALENDPSLVHDQGKRLEAFRKLSKSVDNRYGEMAYNTLFWNRMVKDLAVANTLSLGWQMGFLREYGGGTLDLGQFATKGSIPKKIAAGKMDRPLFVMYYTTQALAYGGLMTYALTGKPPQSIWDYVFPLEKEGARLSTMFYTREFGSIIKHAQTEGVAAGMKDIVESKSSGVVGLMTEVATGVNSWGEEIRKPDDTLVHKTEQTLKDVLTDVTPISFGSMQKGGNPALSIMGFTPAPKYVTDSPAEAYIKFNYQKYSASKMTPYERTEQSTDTQKLRQLHKEGKDEEYDAQADMMKDKYGRDTVRRLQQSIKKGADPTVKMFERLTWQQQKTALDKMSPDERERYLKHSNKEHLRKKYTAEELE